jgi:hypothetical protein
MCRHLLNFYAFLTWSVYRYSFPSAEFFVQYEKLNLLWLCSTEEKIGMTVIAIGVYAV